MKVFYSVPVSGGYLPSQIQLLLDLYQAGFRSDVIFSTSGGNVAAYLVVSCGWDKQRVNDMLEESCRSNLNKNNLFRKLQVLFTNSFDQGLFDSDVITDAIIDRIISSDIEVWTGTYNMLSHCSGFFCNFSEENAYIKQSFVDHNIAMCEMTYTDSDPTLISAYSKASLSIPMLMKPVQINNAPHVDGGFNWSSPLIPLTSNITEPHCIVLVYPSNLDSTQTIPSPIDLVTSIHRNFEMLTDGHIRTERFYSIERLKYFAKLTGKRIERMLNTSATAETLVIMHKIIQESEYSLLIVSPVFNQTTGLYSMDYERIVNIMRLCSKYFCADLYYLVSGIK